MACSNSLLIETARQKSWISIKNIIYKLLYTPLDT